MQLASWHTKLQGLVWANSIPVCSQNTYQVRSKVDHPHHIALSKAIVFVIELSVLNEALAI